jgi:hypothetical protein
VQCARQAAAVRPAAVALVELGLRLAPSGHFSILVVLYLLLVQAVGLVGVKRLVGAVVPAAGKPQGGGGRVSAPHAWKRRKCLMRGPCPHRSWFSSRSSPSSSSDPTSRSLCSSSSTASRASSGFTSAGFSSACGTPGLSPGEPRS